jgi:hypothetical protein
VLVLKLGLLHYCNLDALNPTATHGSSSNNSSISGISRRQLPAPVSTSLPGSWTFLFPSKLKILLEFHLFLSLYPSLELQLIGKGYQKVLKDEVKKVLDRKIKLSVVALTFWYVSESWPQRRQRRSFSSYFLRTF